MAEVESTNGPASTVAAATSTSPAMPATTVTQPAQGTQDAMLQIPKSAFKAVNGDWHKGVENLNAYQQAMASGAIQPELGAFIRDNGLEPSTVMEFLRNAIAQPEAPASVPQSGGETLGQFTPEAVAQIVGKALDEKMSAREQAAAQRQMLTQARQTEANFTNSVLKETKFVTDTGERSPFADEAEGIWSRVLATEMQNDVPAYITGDQRAKEVRRIFDLPASQEALSRAKERFVSRMRDFSNHLVSQFAQGQTNIPGASLSSGAGGAQPPIDLANMTPQQAASLSDKDRRELAINGYRRQMAARGMAPR